ncbi:ImmA/IrrE family metallo-endopeptidase [Candidatus Vondammii sp. HM_W22]|uniref:ImmA/IrrE family metallo-endopeptidase n=1 Tax=Candidatus Vondammii sp. HM_W22 TaxID=2687299 RepID=UPI00403E1C56
MTITLIIRSTAKTAPTRLRFDTAHERGHLVMHIRIVTGDTGTEAQANRFASAFLLPRRDFVREFPRSRRIDW